MKGKIRARGDQQGIALMLVIAVLSALVLLSLTLAIVMSYQSRSSASFMAETHARLGTQGIRDWAVGRLTWTNETYEREGNLVDPYRTPYVDDFSEVFLRLDDLKSDVLTGPFSTTIPGNQTWGLWTEDEQGKIRVEPASDRAITNLRTLLAETVVPRSRFLTDYSRRQVHWAYPQNIRDFQGNGVSVDDSAFLGNQTRVRISDGSRQVFSRVAGIDPNSGYVLLNPPLSGWPVGSTILEIESPYPVNINTAKRQVLISIFRGLTMFADPNDPNYDEVTLSEAQALTTRILQQTQPIQGPADFLRILADSLNAQEISTNDAAVIGTNSLIPTHRRLQGTGTVPFDYRSYDTYTVEALAVANNPAGDEIARRFLREVVSPAPLRYLVWDLDSQYDWEYHLNSVYGQTIGLSSRSYPHGKFVHTFPAKTWQGEAPSENLGDPENRWEIQTATDRRGTAQIFVNHESFNSEHEGDTLPYTKPVAQAVQMDDRSSVPNRDFFAGGTEFWIRFDSIPNGDAYIFDSSDGKYYEDRICLLWLSDTAELVFRCADGTIDSAFAEVRVPNWIPRPNVWYHIGAYWKGTQYAHLGLFIDGFPAGGFTHVFPDNQTEPFTRLTADLQPGDTTIQLSDPSGFPTSGVIEIGNEVIFYDNDFQTIVRGVRGTQAALHPAGVAVSLFGYFNPLANQAIDVPGAGQANPMSLHVLPQVAGTLAQTIPGPGNRTTVKMPADPNDPSLQPEISATETTIFTPIGGTASFPDTGYILIGQEVIQYGGKQTGVSHPRDQTPSDSFTGCSRGSLGTGAAVHAHGAAIQLWGFPCNNTGGYRAQEVIQIDDEWFGPGTFTLDASHYTGLIIGGVPQRLQRGMVSTARLPHASGSDLIPVFAVLRGVSGSGDIVTLLDDTPDKEPHLVRVFRQSSGVQLMSFFTQVNRTWTGDGAITRVLKFPSGELPSRLPSAFVFSGSVPNDVDTSSLGSFPGTIDEVKFFASPKGNFRLIGGVDDASGTMVVNGAGGMNVAGGVIKVGDEYIGYPDVDQNTGQVSNAIRGYLGSSPEVHDDGARAFNFSFLPISRITNSISATTNVFPIASNGQGWNPEGYMYVDGEVMGYTALFPMAGGGSVRVQEKLPGEGLYRGSFGTTPMNHAPDTLAYNIPHRYWDRYEPQHYDTTMVYYQAAREVNRAVWMSLEWDIEIPDPTIKVYLQMRFDERGEWTGPVNANGGILQVDASSGNSVPLDIEASRVEIRVLVDYEPGAFFPGDGWKMTPKVRRIRMQYRQATEVHYHEEK